MALYDAITQNDSANMQMGDAHTQGHRPGTSDQLTIGDDRLTLKETVCAKMRPRSSDFWLRYKYPPDVAKNVASNSSSSTEHLAAYDSE